MKMRKALSILLAVLMLLSSLSLTVLAEGTVTVATAAALRTAVEAGGSVKMTDNIDLGGSYLAVTGNVTLDLNGYTLSNKNAQQGQDSVLWVSSDGVLTVTDSSTAQTGTIDGSASGKGIQNNGTVNLQGGTVKGSVINSKNGTILHQNGILPGYVTPDDAAFIWVHDNDKTYILPYASEGVTFTNDQIAVGTRVFSGGQPKVGDMVKTVTITDASGDSVPVDTFNSFKMPSGDVTISVTFAKCSHESDTEKVYVDNENGTHSLECPLCWGKVEPAAHNFGTDGKCADCGAESDSNSGAGGDNSGEGGAVQQPSNDSANDSWYEEESADTHTSKADLKELLEELGGSEDVLRIELQGEDDSISYKAMKLAAEEGLDLELDGRDQGYFWRFDSSKADWEGFKGSFRSYVDVDAGPTTSLKKLLKDADHWQIVKTEHEGKVPAGTVLAVKLDKELRSADELYLYYWNSEEKKLEEADATMSRENQYLHMELERFYTCVISDTPFETAVQAESASVPTKTNPETGAGEGFFACR